MTIYINRVSRSKIEDVVKSSSRSYTHAVNGLKLITNTNNSSFKLTAGKAIFYNDDFSNPIELNIPNRIINPPPLLQTSNVAYIALDSSGNYQYQATQFQSWQLDDKLPIGAVTSLDGGQTISQIFPFIINSDPDSKATLDYGMKNITADTIRIQGIENTLKLKIGSGKIRSAGRNYFINTRLPHLTTFSAQNPITFRYVNQDGSIESVTDTLDTTKYERNGSLALLSAGRASLQQVYMSASGSVAIQRGQEQYGSIGDTAKHLSGERHIKAPSLSGFIKIGAIGIKTGTTNILRKADALIYVANKDGVNGGDIIE